MKRFLILTFSLSLLQSAKGQSTLFDSAKNELYRINKMLDSSRYLGFDMNIKYKNDSAGFTIETDQLNGSYVLNQKNLFYQMGSTKYIQTDSFSYSIYEDEKMLLMAKNGIQQNSDAFPLRMFMDSAMNYYKDWYSVQIDTIYIDSADYIKRIQFQKINDSSAEDAPPYYSFFIDYDDISYYPLKFEFTIKHIVPETATQTSMSSNVSIPSTTIFLNTITMVFSNYRGITDTGIFDDTRYVFFNRQRKIYEPMEKYQNYRFLTSGFNNEDADSQYYNEVPYTPENNN